MGKEYSRRSFLAGAGLGAVSLSAALMGCGKPAENGGATGQPSAKGGDYTFADTVKWDGEFDVVVMGFGGAGATAARFAADAGASVLLCDKAPEGHEGGNTRYCGQLVFTGTKKEDLISYAKGLGWKMGWDEEYLDRFCEGMAGIPEYLKKYLGAEVHSWKKDQSPTSKMVNTMNPEYPELAGNGEFDMVTISDAISNGKLWEALRKQVMERKDKIKVWFESPVKKLIQDPVNRTIVGAVIEHGSKSLNVRALNGVIMSCGGFENNIEMQHDYLDAPRMAPIGSLYNTGDGFGIATEVGAQLWHMCVYEGITNWGSNHVYVEPGERAKLLSSSDYKTGSLFVVGDDGSRFVREDENTRHGHVYSHGVYRNPITNAHPYVIFDETKKKELEAKADTNRFNNLYAQTKSANTIEELAKMCDLKPEILKETFDNFNYFAENGKDYLLGRDPKTMRKFDGGPYYAGALIPSILNTQGGARRNKDAQIVDVNGKPIPHLYSCGEFGCSVPFQYQGGFNMAECLIFGKIAGENAAAKKDALAAYEPLKKVESKPEFTIATKEAEKKSEKPKLGPNEYYGEANGIGGTVGVVVKMDGDKIADIKVVKQDETPEIGGKALEDLVKKAVAANGADIDNVSGATVTSNAFKEAVKAALAQAK